MEIYLRSRGRITIPVSVRRRLGIEHDTIMHFELDEQARRIILTPVKPAPTRKRQAHLSTQPPLMPD